MRRNIGIAVTVATLAVPVAPAAAATTWHVEKPANGGNDANACTQAAPCLTIGHVVGLAEVVDDDTVQIGPGTFTEAVSTSKRLSFVGSGGGTGGQAPGAGDTVIAAPGAVGAAALRLFKGGGVASLRATGAGGANLSDAIRLETNMVIAPVAYTVANVVAEGGLNGTSGRSALLVTDAVQPGNQIDMTVTGGHFGSAGTTNSLEVVSPRAPTWPALSPRRPSWTPEPASRTGAASPSATARPARSTRAPLAGTSPRACS